MSVENVLWGAPRIHGELLKLGFAVAQSTVAKYMAKKGVTTLRERTAHWTRMHRSRALFIGSDALCHMRWSADFITDTSESEFSAHTGMPAGGWAP